MAEGKKSKFEMVIGAVDRFSGVFQGFNSRLDSANEKLVRLNRSCKGLSAATGFTRLSGAVQNLKSRFGDVLTEGKNLFSTLAGLAGKAALVFGGAGGGVLALAKGVADAGDAAVKSAQRAGVGIEIWQEYAHAADLADLEQEKLIKGFAGLQDAAIKATQGDKTKAGAFKLLGINPKTAKGEIKTADSLFMELADKIQALQAAGKGAQAVNLLGDIMGDRDARSFIPMLSAGAEGLAAARKEAHRLGIVLTSEDGKAAEEFNDNFTRLQAAFKGFGFSIGKDLLPPISALAGKFTDWIAAQRGIVSGGLKEWIEKINVDELFDKFLSGVETLKNMGRTVNGLAQFFGGWGNVLTAVVGIISGKFILSLANLALAFGKVGLALLTTPVGWFLAALAGIGAAVYAIYKNWDGFVAYFEGLWGGVKAAFERNWLSGVVTFLRDFNPLALILDGMNALIKYFTGLDLKGMLLKKLQDLASGLPDWAKKMLFGDGDDAALAAKPQSNPMFSGLDDAALAAKPQSNPMFSGLDDFGFAPARDLAPAMRDINETRTEHVEREEVRVVVESKDGSVASVQRSGGGDSNVSFSQNGQLAMGHF
jgi:hypothetical protein